MIPHWIRRIWLSSLFLIIALTLLALTWSMGYTARQVPLTVAVPTTILLLLQWCLDLSPRLSGAVSRFLSLRLRSLKRSVVQQASLMPEQRRSLGATLVWFAAAPLAIYLLGFAFAAPLYTFSYLRFSAGESWKLSLTMSVAVAIVVYLLFFLPADRSVWDGLMIALLVNN